MLFLFRLLKTSNNLNFEEMKTMFRSIMIFFAAMALFSCTEKYEVYNLPQDRLGFVYKTDSFGSTVQDSIDRFSFVYLSSEIVSDTVWVEMATSGFVTDYDRPFKVEQVQLSEGDLRGVANIVNAQAGSNYIEFTSAEISKYLVVKAGQNSVKFPVVVKRDGPNTDNGSVYLRLKLKETDTFAQSFPANRFYTIEVTNQLVKPACWDVLEYYFGGDYGVAKLRFMIDMATWTINDKWFQDNFADYASVDMGYTGYLSTYYTNKLIEYNQARAAKGEDVLREADGTIVQFVSYGMAQPYI